MSLDARSWIRLAGIVAVELTAQGAMAACPDHLKFLESRCEQWQSYLLPETIPASRGNNVADNVGAAALGMKIFYDNRFSRSGSGVACVNCHDPEHSFAERKPTSHTIGEVGRNAPDLIDAAWYTRAHFWDGKVDNLWSAPLFTFEQDAEMGSTRLHVVHTLASIYKVRYEKVFGPMADLSDTTRFPTEGKPGMAQFDAMSEQDKDIVNQLYANVGKALEAYIRKLAAGRSRFDDFISGSPKTMTIEAQHGMLAFTRNGCDGCHSGPTFTDENFHNLGYQGKAGLPKDPARAGGIAVANKWQFTSTGKYADPTTDDSTPDAPRVASKPDGFRTPSLRNLELTSPYGHDGSFETLDQVLDAHARVLPKRATLSAQDKHDIIEFLHSLNGRPPQPPWNYWPGG